MRNQCGVVAVVAGAAVATAVVAVVAINMLSLQEVSSKLTVSPHQWETIVSIRFHL